MTAQTPVRPIAGATFKRIAAQRIEGTKRRKLLALIAAYSDGGQPSCSADELAERLGWEPIKVRVLLERLEADGLVERTRNRRRRYRVLLDGGAITPAQPGRAA